jgi:hypothetical protein
MRRLLLILFVMGTSVALSQEILRKEVDIQQILDELISYQDEELNYEELYENYLQLLQQPLNLNTASVEQLRALYILSESQVQEFIAYRNEQGKLLSVYELQTLPSFDLPTIQKIAPFITVSDPTPFATSFINNLLHNDNNYLLLRYERTIQEKEGFVSMDPQKQFLGDRNKYYMRFRTSMPNDFSVGFTAEQDAGESFRWKPTSQHYGADFISFHLQTQNKGIIKNLILGDYQLQVGQGLLCGGTFSTGKGGETISTIRKSNLLGMPYTSADENHFLRGFTTTLSLPKNFFLTTFLSSTRRDANRNADTVNRHVSSLLTTGFHRNAAELEDRKALSETMVGGLLHLNYKALDAGYIHQYIQYNHPLMRAPSAYNQFSFFGRSNTNQSIYTNYTYHNFTFFSEAAISSGGGKALVVGTLGSLSKKVDVSLLYRNYQRNFYTFYANSFSESTVPQNEKGFYWGIKYHAHSRVQVASYVDLFIFPWLRYRSYSPSVGHEWLLRFHYQPSKSITFTTQYRQEEKQRNRIGESTLYQTAQGKKQSLFLHADYSLGPVVKMKSRLQYSTYSLDGQNTQGMTAFQDITVDFGKLSISGRYALFDTEDYDNRQYVYEKNVWLAYSMPAYSGKGIRTYLLVQYTLHQHVTCWVRYAQVRFHDQQSIGSGLDKIINNQRNDISLQVRVKI